MSLLALHGHVRYLFLVLFPVDGTHHLEYRRHNQHHTPTSHNYFLVDTVAVVGRLAVLWECCPQMDCDPSQIRGWQAILSVQDYAIDSCCDVLLSPQYLALPDLYDAVDGDGEVVGGRRHHHGRSSCDVYVLNSDELAIDSGVYGGRYPFEV